MINEDRVNDQKRELSKQVRDMMTVKEMNDRSFDVFYHTVANIRKRCDGNISSLLSIADELGCDVRLIPRE